MTPAVQGRAQGWAHSYRSAAIPHWEKLIFKHENGF